MYETLKKENIEYVILVGIQVIHDCNAITDRIKVMHDSNPITIEIRAICTTK
jgi:hypothetical protein